MSKHDDTAERIAKQQGTSYNSNKGADVVNSDRAIEVETTKSMSEAKGQLRGYRKPVYVAGADAEATKEAKRLYADSDIGVMNSKGQIVKRSTRKRSTTK